MPKGIYNRTHPAWNKGLTKETNEKVRQYSIKCSESKKGTKLSEETKRKIADKTKLSHANGKRGYVYKKISASKLGHSVSQETRDRISKTLTGRKLSPELRKKLSLIHKGKHSGENSNFWRGGTSTLIAKLRSSPEYNDWRFKVFKRDNFTCQKCNKISKGDIEAHHLDGFSNIIHRNNITNYEEALNCKELWDVKNGLTLCIKCHRKTDNYGTNTGFLVTAKKLK